jgi:hypothetical protein
MAIAIADFGVGFPLVNAGVDLVHGGPRQVAKNGV